MNRFHILLLATMNPARRGGTQRPHQLRCRRGHPLVPAQQRAAVLAALACVDAVVIFPQERAHRFLAAVQPDVYVKGGDYRPETLFGRERAVLTATGSKIHILPYVRGFSTTGL